jgi:threonine synthase
MKHLGLTDRVPRISVVQAEGANPLYRSMQASDGRELTPVEAHTRASAIRIGNPASWKKAVRVVHASGGSVEQVSEAEIALAKAEIGAEGIGCEPASAVTLAGLKKFVAAGKIDSSETVVLLLTGHTLKDSEYTIQYHRGDLLRDEELTGLRAEIDATRRNPVELDADPDQVLRTLEQVGL